MAMVWLLLPLFEEGMGGWMDGWRERERERERGGMYVF